MSHASPPVSPPPDSNPSQTKCFAHQHMTATEYAIWSVCRAMASAHNGVVFFSGPKIARKFSEMGRNTPYTTVKSLVKLGWFKMIKKSYRRANNTFTPTHYQVLDHEQWVAEHPGRCNPAQDEDAEPSQLKGMDICDPTSGPSQLKGCPSQPEGTNLYEQPIQEPPSSLTPSQLEGMDLLNRFGKRQRGNAKAQILSARPSPLNGTDPNTGIDEPERITSALMETLGVVSSGSAALWRDAVESLRRRGQNRDQILAVAAFVRKNYGDNFVQKHGAGGFKLGFAELQKQMKAEKEINQ